MTKEHGVMITRDILDFFLKANLFHAIDNNLLDIKQEDLEIYVEPNTGESKINVEAHKSKGVEPFFTLKMDSYYSDKNEAYKACLGATLMLLEAVKNVQVKRIIKEVK